MINAHDVCLLCRGAQSFNPPAVVIGRMVIPCIQRVAPKLAIGAEVNGKLIHESDTKAAARVQSGSADVAVPGDTAPAVGETGNG